MPTVVIHQHRAAPTKPAPGAPCNGCGLCCLLETCPLARLRYLRRAGPCPALHWHATLQRYQCGFLVTPNGQPRRLARLTARWIAAGAGCDCTAEIAPTA